MASRAPCVASVDPGELHRLKAHLVQSREVGSALVIERRLRGHRRRIRKPPAIPTSSITMAQPMAFFHTGLW